MYNNGMNPLPDFLKNNQSIFCEQTMTPKAYSEFAESDSFEYVCENCNPRIVVSLGGSLVVDIEKIMQGYKQRLAFYKTRLKEHQQRVFKLTSEDFK